MVNGIRLQKPSPNAVTVAVGVAPKANAASATTSTPSAANTHASGNQRSAHAALRRAARAIQPSCDAFMPFSALIAPSSRRDGPVGKSTMVGYAMPT